MPIITTNLREAYSHDAVNCSTAVLVQIISERKKIDGRGCMHQLPLYHYWQHFDCNCVHIIRQRQTNNGARDGRDVMYTKNDTPHSNQISDKEKGCNMVGHSSDLLDVYVMSL